MINVIGLGYIGLPTALMMASHGVEVIGTDYNKELVIPPSKKMALMNCSRKLLRRELSSLRSIR